MSYIRMRYSVIPMRKPYDLKAICNYMSSFRNILNFVKSNVILLETYVQKFKCVRNVMLYSAENCKIN